MASETVSHSGRITNSPELLEKCISGRCHAEKTGTNPYCNIWVQMASSALEKRQLRTQKGRLNNQKGHLPDRKTPPTEQNES